MKIDSLYIENFKSIKSVHIEEVDNAFILVGKNNAGKSSVIDAIRAVLGEYKIRREYFQDPDKNVVIEPGVELLGSPGHPEVIGKNARISKGANNR